METIALTYAELAVRLGIKVESAKARVRRNGWQTMKANGRGRKVLVQVPVEALSGDTEADMSADVTANVTHNVTPDVSQFDQSVVTLRETVAGLTAELMSERERRQEAVDRHKHEIGEMRERVADITSERDRWADMASQLCDKLDEMDRHQNRGLIERLFGRHVSERQRKA